MCKFFTPAAYQPTNSLLTCRKEVATTSSLVQEDLLMVRSGLKGCRTRRRSPRFARASLASPPPTQNLRVPHSRLCQPRLWAGRAHVHVFIYASRPSHHSTFALLDRGRSRQSWTGNCAAYQHLHSLREQDFVKDRHNRFLSSAFVPASHTRQLPTSEYVLLAPAEGGSIS